MILRSQIMFCILYGLSSGVALMFAIDHVRHEERAKAITEILVTLPINALTEIKV